MKLLVSLSLFLFSASLWAQDERYMRKLFSGELREKKEKEFNPMPKIQTLGKAYKFDIDDDGRVESFISEKSDGGESLLIQSFKGDLIYRARLETAGLDSWLYRVTTRQISEKTRLFILHFYEGGVEYFNFRGNSRAYFLTLENKDVKTLSLYKGPVIFDEKKFRYDHYHLRSYKFNLVDLNRDGVKEVVLKYHLNSWVYMYKSAGKWIEL